MHRSVLLVILLLAACAPPPRGPEYIPVTRDLPPIPAVDGPLEIRVMHPTPQVVRPRTDSTFVYGSVGTGKARLTINDIPVPVAPNGAFLAYLPVPESGSYHLEARVGRRQKAERVVSYRTPTAGATAGASPAREVFPEPLPATVTGGADTLATGSAVAIGRPTPTGEYRWFLPRGARLRVTERQGGLVRARLDESTTAWFPDTLVTVDPTASELSPLGPVAVRPAEEWVDVEIDAGGRPFRVEPQDDRLDITLHDARAPVFPPTRPQDLLVRDLEWSSPAPGQARLTLRLDRPVWGYKAFYGPAGELVVRVRRPPRVDVSRPLAGLRVAVDPGHPPGGTVGPTGLTEAEVNLQISQRLARRLRDAGAEVLLVRTDATPLSLAERTQRAVDWDAHLLVSVHNNAPPEGANPFRHTGTSTYYFQPFSEGLARSLNEAILPVTRLPDMGVRQGNLALVRPTWFPSALTEPLFMLVPEQEAALRNERFLERLAEAHARGIENFVRDRQLGRS